MQRKLAPPSAVVGAKGRRLHIAAFIVVRRLFTDQIKTRALSSASLQLCKTISVFALPPTPYDSTQLMNGSCFMTERTERISAGIR
jgi:hypothetical protein